MAHEIHEKIEHAAHEGDGSSRLPQFIGITVAILGVLMALCSAQVGEARTELIAAMVEESAAQAKYTAVASKYRLLQVQLQQTHALMPDVGYQKAKNDELKTLYAEVKDPETKRGLEFSKLNAERVLNTVTPTEKDVMRFVKMLHRTRVESDAAKEWSESYRDRVEVHENTADRFEVALLGAEIGIVIASVALLLAKKKAFARGTWSIAIVLGVLSLTLAVQTKLSNMQKLHGAEEKIEESKKEFEGLIKDQDDIAEDKKLEEEIIEEFKAMRKLITGS